MIRIFYHKKNFTSNFFSKLFILEKIITFVPFFETKNLQIMIRNYPPDKEIIKPTAILDHGVDATSRVYFFSNYSVLPQKSFLEFFQHTYLKHFIFNQIENQTDATSYIFSQKFSQNLFPTNIFDIKKDIPYLQKYGKIIEKQEFFVNFYNGVDVTSFHYVSDTTFYSHLSTDLIAFHQNKFFKNLKENSVLEIKFLQKSSFTEYYEKNDSVYFLTVYNSFTSNIPIKTYFSEKNQSLKTDFNRQFWSDVPFFVILFSFLLVLAVKLFYKKYLSQLFISLSSFRKSQKFFNENNILAQRASLIMNGVFYINIALFLCEINAFYTKESFSFLRFTIYLGIIFGISILKDMILKMLGLIFDAENFINECRFNIGIFNKMIGLSFFPVVLFIPYISYNVENQLVVFSFYLFLFLYGLYFYRSVQIILQKHISPFYMFLYFCTVEMLPLGIIYRFLNI